MIFNSSKVAFGRHESFALRYSWPTKGFKAVQANSEVFTSPDATVTLGVGKNMVNAIRFWLLASQMIKPSEEKGFEPEEIGKEVLDESGYDPYIEDEATLWLIHWLIATNPEKATAWYWFFNEFHKPEFDSDEVARALVDFVSQKEIKSAITTIKKDANVVLRMYARSKIQGNVPLEEALDSPLSQLGLITHSADGRMFSSPPADREGLPDEILGFAIADLFACLSVRELPVEDLMYSKDGILSPGAVFRLTESALITKLERLIRKVPGIFELRETAGIHQIYLLEDIDRLFFLEQYYEPQTMEDAA